MGTKQSFSEVLKGYWQGLKSLKTRNAVIIIAVYALNQYANNMKNGFRTLMGSQEIGLSTTVVGAAVSVFLFAAMIIRTPAGSITDQLRGKLKMIISGALALKAIVWCGFLIVSNAVGYYVLFAVDGALWGFLGTALPALLAMSLDRRAMGSGYALMFGLTSIVCSSSRSVGNSLFTNHGTGTAVLACGVVAVISALAVLLLDGSKFFETSPKAANDSKKKGLLSGLSISMLPMTILAGFAGVVMYFEQNFIQIYAAEMQFDYLAAQTAGQAAQGTIALFTGVLCDLLSPSLVLIIALLGQFATPLIYSFAATSELFSLGLFIGIATRFYSATFRILGMKTVARSEQGAFSATLLFCNDIVSICSSTVLGACATAFGYHNSFIGMAVWQGLVLVAFIVLNQTYIKKLAARRATD